MSKKKKKSVPVAPPKSEKKLVIDMNKVNRDKRYHVPSFKTGRHMTEKDRPRKKDWKREYERQKGSSKGEYLGTGPFILLVTVNRDPEQYLCTSIEEDVKTLNEFLNWWAETPYDHYNAWISETYDALKKAGKI